MQLHVVGNVRRGDGDKAVLLAARIGDRQEAAAHGLAWQCGLGGGMMDLQVAELEIMRECRGSGKRHGGECCKDAVHGYVLSGFHVQEKMRRSGGTKRMTN